LGNLSTPDSVQKLQTALHRQQLLAFFRGAVRLVGQLWGQSDGAERGEELHARLLGNASRAQIPSIARRSLAAYFSERQPGPPPRPLFGSIEVEGVTRRAKHPPLIYISVCEYFPGGGRSPTS
jgi:hypothetical protein